MNPTTFSRNFRPDGSCRYIMCPASYMLTRIRPRASAEKCRIAEVPFDRGPQRVELADGLRVRLVATGITAAELAGAAIDLELKSLQGPAGVPAELLEELTRDAPLRAIEPLELVVRLPAPGRYSVRPLLLGHDDGSSRQAEIAGANALELEVAEAGDELRVEMPLPSQAVAAAVAELAAKRR